MFFPRQNHSRLRIDYDHYKSFHFGRTVLSAYNIFYFVILLNSRPPCREVLLSAVPLPTAVLRATRKRKAFYKGIKIKSVALQPRRAKTDWSGCCQMRVQGVLWLAKRLSLKLKFSFLNRISLLLMSSSYPIVLTRLGGPRSRPYTSRKISRV